MTQEERTAVHIASKPECRMHQSWPKEVLEKFLAAEVITGPQLNHKASLSLDAGFFKTFLMQLLPAGGGPALWNVTR